MVQLIARCASCESQAWLTSGCHMRRLQSLVWFTVTLKGFGFISTVALSCPAGTGERRNTIGWKRCKLDGSVQPIKLCCIRPFFFSFFFFFLMWFLCTRFWEIADTVMFREVVVVVWRTLHLVLVMYVLKAFQCVCVFEWVIKWVCVFEWLNECVCGKLQVGKNLYTLLHFIIVSWLVFLFIRCFLYIFASKWKRIWSLLFVFVFFWGVFFSFFLSFFEKGDFFSLCLSSFVYSIIS